MTFIILPPLSKYMYHYIGKSALNLLHFPQFCDIIYIMYDFFKKENTIYGVPINDQRH